MARAIPHRGPDGELDGYRLSGIRRNSVLSQLGIRNGDVIHAVNGHSLSSVQDAMGAYQGLQSESGFAFDVTRRGQKMNMEYDVR
jgi:type II secretory pathway component PulC